MYESNIYVYELFAFEKKTLYKKVIRDNNKWNHLHHHHHHVMLPAWISVTLSHHSSKSSIAPGRSSRLHPVSAQSCCIWVIAGRPAFSCLCEGAHMSISLLSSSLLLHQCPAFLFRLTWIGRCLYSCCFVRHCLQDLFNTNCSILA